MIGRLERQLHARLDLWLHKQRIADLDPEGRGQVITDDAGSLYLVRVYLMRLLRSRLPGWFLHRFFRSDHDRELHNHPWKWSASLVLTGGYLEERLERPGGPVMTRVLRPLSWNVIRSTTYHRVQLLDEERGAWTLFIAGPKLGTWGFLDPKTGAFEEHSARSARLKAARISDVDLEMLRSKPRTKCRPCSGSGRVLVNYSGSSYDAECLDCDGTGMVEA
jgi:hypothetical protein